MIRAEDAGAAHKRLSDALSKAEYKNSLGDPLQVSSSGAGYRVQDKFKNDIVLEKADAENLMKRLEVFHIKNNML